MQTPRIVQDNRFSPHRLYQVNSEAGAATIYLYDVIGEWGISARQFVKDFATITADKIHLRINSPGGSVDDARAIAAHLKESSKHVTAHVDGLAASAAAFLTLAADKIEMQDGAFLMVHNPWTVTLGNAEEHEATAILLRKYGDAIIKDYVAATGQSEAQIREWFDAETWFTAAEALEAGLVDAIAAPAEKQPAAARWNLAAFAHVPAALAFQPNPHPTKELNMPLTHPPADSVQAAVQAERTRQDDIRRIGEGLSLPAEMIQNALTTGVQTDAFRTVALEEKFRLDQVHQLRGQNSSAHIVSDGADRTRQAFSEALGVRLFNHPAANVDERFRNRRLGDMMAAYHREMGFPPANDITGVIQQAMGGVWGAAQKTSDFPQILGDQLGKYVVDMYKQEPAALKPAAYLRDVSDYRQLNIVRAGEYSLAVVPEGDDFPQAIVGEYAGGFKVDVHAAYLTLTLQAIVNDDTAAFQGLARAAGPAAAAAEAKLLVDRLTANAGTGQILTMDSKPIFHIDHKNLSATGSVLDIDSLQAGELAMMLQTGVGPDNVPAYAKYLIVPPSLKVKAEQLVATLTPSSSGEVNPFAGRLTVLVEPRLEAVSPIRWYLASDPNRTRGLELAYLLGGREPKVEQQTNFYSKAFEMTVMLSFGCGAVDYRGLYQDPGAVPTP